MTPTIIIPAGTAHVTVSDIPGMIAEALQPRALDGQNKAISQLMKISSDSANNENMDERPLEPEDWAYLAKVWADLPTYRDGISAHDWEQYLDAWLAEARPWKLIVFWTGTATADRLQRITTLSEHLKALTWASDDGSLIVRSPSRVPILNAMGDTLMRALVTIPDLVSYVERFGITVEVVTVTTTAPIAAEGGGEPWQVADPRDGDLEAFHPWGVSARYFARELVRSDPKLVANRAQLQKKVSAALSAIGIRKRGGVNDLDPATVNKALTNLKY